MTTIAIIGGTGPQGSGLGFRFARGGHHVILGSRSQERAIQAAAELDERLSEGGSVRGASNTTAAGLADLVVLAVPYSGHRELVEELAQQLSGKLVISCVNPLGFDKVGPFGLDMGPTSAAEEAQGLLPDSQVVGAFHHLSAVTLLSDIDVLEHEDVLVCGDDIHGKSQVIDLASTVTGKAGIDAGPLRLARQLEPLTGVLISINRRYKVRAGISISGLS